MDFKVFPQPRPTQCTPFVQISTTTYARYHNAGPSGRTLISASISPASGAIVLKGHGSDRIFGTRKPDRKRVLDFLAHHRRRELLRYVESTNVVPTFAATLEEAFVKTLCRQLIRATHAATIFSCFIQEYGWSLDGIYGFPTLGTLVRLSLSDWRQSRFGFKAVRLYSGVQVLRTGTSTRDLPGLGPWSAAVMDAELQKDYTYYPMEDRSGEVIETAFGVNAAAIARRDRKLAADLYIYGSSAIGARQ